MSEDNNTDNASTTSATDTAPATEAPDITGSISEPMTWEDSPIAQVYNPDGTPKAEAAKALAGMGREDIAGHALRNGQDFFTALKTGKDAAAFASSKQEGMVKMPGEDASDEDRATFNQSLGALSSKEDYMANMWPDDLPKDFARDEGLADVFAEHVSKFPINTAESTKALVAGVLAYQGTQQETGQQEYAAEAEKQAKATADTLTVELGGKGNFKEFSDNAKALVTSKEFQEMGFNFTVAEGGALEADNPLHAAMLTDAPILRMIKSMVASNAPAGIPQNNPSTASRADNEGKAREIYKEFGAGPGGWRSTEKMEEYYQLKGIK